MIILIGTKISHCGRSKKIPIYLQQQPLRVLMEEYSGRTGTTMSSLQFWFDGEIVSPADSAESLEMEDGDCLDVNYLTEIVID